MASLSKNIFYNTLFTSAHYVFPLIVYPYVSRVLGVSNIGLVGFIDAISTYFILFSMMGISILGVREVAKCGNDLIRRKTVFRSLLSLHAVMTLLSLVVMIVVALTVPELRKQLPMMGVALCKLIFNLFLIEWFYKGLEDFRYITIRAIAVRGCYVVAVFIFVRDPGDTLIYYFLTMLVAAVSSTINIIHTRHFLPKVKVRINLRKYIKPFFFLGAYELLIAAYTTLNTAFLGFVSSDREVGFYATATKVISIITMLYMSFSAVLLPRMSSLVAEGDTVKFRKYFKKTFYITLIFSFPIIILIEVFAPQVIMLLSGPGYEGAILPLRIMIPFLIAVGIEQLITVQTLMPLGRENDILHITMAGAVVGVILNISLVPSLGAVGSALTWSVAESVILILAFIKIKGMKR